MNVNVIKRFTKDPVYGEVEALLWRIALKR